MTITSRLATWVSSWAMTPSSSAGLSSSMMPVVAQTVAFLGERPSANALGIAVLATATFGFGRSACTHRRSIIACSCGASCGVTTRPPIAASASLSDVKRLQRGKTADDEDHRERALQRSEQHAAEHDVHGAEQEQRDGHADLEAGVLAE